MIRKWLLPIGGERKQDVLEELSQASSPGFDYFLLVLLSCSIATFGLITDSAAVIIGAMLVAPLMSPILGLSLASVAGEQRMFRNAIIALVEGSFLAVALSALLGLIAGPGFPWISSEYCPARSLPARIRHRSTWGSAWQEAQLPRMPWRSRVYPLPCRGWQLPRRSCRRSVPPELGSHWGTRVLLWVPYCSS